MLHRFVRNKFQSCTLNKCNGLQWGGEGMFENKMFNHASGYGSRRTSLKKSAMGNFAVISQFLGAEFCCGQKGEQVKYVQLDAFCHPIEM